MHLYESTYTSLRFERAGLFEAVGQKHRIREVLYPGCSVHITPSLYFPHVVYVDQSEAAARFFTDEPPLMEFLNRHKEYKRSVYLRFIQQDYSQALPLRETSFDLLLALYAGGVSRSCVRYLKAGGLVLTNNHQGDAVDALQHNNLGLEAKIRFHKQGYVVEQCRQLEPPSPGDKRVPLKQMQKGMSYTDHETYYLFRRLS